MRTVKVRFAERYCGAMNRALRLIIGVAAIFASVACAATPSASEKREYAWILAHGGCDCGSVAYPLNSAEPAYFPGTSIDVYVQNVVARCTSQELVLVAFGDGGTDLVRETRLARARTVSFLRLLQAVPHRRLDTLLIVGPRVAHRASALIMCPNAPLPPQSTFA